MGSGWNAAGSPATSSIAQLTGTVPGISVDARVTPVHNGPVDLVFSRVVTYPYVVISMPLNIRSEETEELASALAKLTGETKTEAVTQALRERIQRVRRARAKRRLADELDEIALHCSTLPLLDRRSADEIMGYDANGLPS
jgi:antitoxin VapB